MDICSWLVRAIGFARPSFGVLPTEVLGKSTSQPDPGILRYPMDLGIKIIKLCEHKTAS